MKPDSLVGFGWTCVLLFLAAVFSCVAFWSSGCAAVGKAASALAPHIPAAIEAAERFIEARRELPPVGQCEAVPADLLDGSAAVAVCSPGNGWLTEAARVLTEAAEADGEPIDFPAAGCFPSENGLPLRVCVAPYVE